MSAADVLVVGAGPVGLTAALAAVRSGLAVDLVEARPGLGSDSLASTFHPPTLRILADLGVDLTGRGLEAPTICYRDTTGVRAVRLSLDELRADTAFPYRRHVPQTEVCEAILSELVRSPACRVRFATRAGPASVGDYPWVFAADGAASGLRAAAGVDFTGHDYDATAVRLLCAPDDFADWDPVTYVFAADSSLSVLRMADHVRVIVRAAGLPSGPDAARAEAARVTGVSPEVLDWSFYRSQRRVAATNVAGNVILIGDSAHVTTTRGGMNMNAGIHDAAVLATALARGRLPGAAAERLRVARELLLPRTHETLEAPLSRLAHVEALSGDPGARRDFLRRGAMLDMVTWP